MDAAYYQQHRDQRTQAATLYYRNHRAEIIPATTERNREERAAAKQAVAHKCECGCGEVTSVRWIRSKGWVAAPYCLGHSPRAKALQVQWPTAILAAMRWHLEQHPDDSLATALVADLENAMQKKRGVARIVKDFNDEPEYRDLRRVRTQWAFRHKPSRITSEGRFSLTVGRIYWGVAQGKPVPRLRSLVRPGGTGRRGATRHALPEGLRTPWGFVVFCAVVQKLQAAGLSQVDIAERFGYSHQRRYSPMVSVLQDVAQRLSRHSPWKQAQRQAAAYLP